MSSSSQSRCNEGNHTVQMVSKHASRVISFDNLDDSSPDAHDDSPPGITTVVLSPLKNTHV
jgi:hypothetical protein